MRITCERKWYNENVFDTMPRDEPADDVSTFPINAASAISMDDIFITS